MNDDIVEIDCPPEDIDRMVRVGFIEIVDEDIAMTARGVAALAAAARIAEAAQEAT